MTDRIDIHDPIYEIANRLGLEPNNVREIVFKPRSVVATVYLLNGDGKKHIINIDPNDPDSGEPATETLEFEVTT